MLHLFMKRKELLIRLRMYRETMERKCYWISLLISIKRMQLKRLLYGMRNQVDTSFYLQKQIKNAEKSFD